MTHEFPNATCESDLTYLKDRLFDMITPQTRTELLVRHTLLEQQLAAIKELISLNQQTEAATRIAFEELGKEIEANPDNEQLDILREGRFWKAVFMDSAYSMSAVGMLAPFIESLFVTIFDGLKDRVAISNDDPRHKLGEQERWNAKIYYSNRSKGRRQDLLQGIRQLSAATGLTAYLPSDTQASLEALFRYRNNMLHNGFEWPSEKVKGFNKDMAKWPESWFAVAKRNDQPWLIYMTPEFCAHCVALIEQIVNGVGQYLRDRGL